MKKQKDFSGAIICIFMWIVLIVCIYISRRFFVKTLDNTQFELCEQVAEDVYNQLERGQDIIEVPEGFYAHVDQFSIEVGIKDFHGYVIGKLQNGDIVITQYSCDGEVELASIFGGIGLFVLLVAIFTIIKGIWENRENRS